VACRGIGIKTLGQQAYLPGQPALARSMRVLQMWPRVMRNRDHYRDHGLVFAKRPEDLLTPRAELGTPCVALTKRYHTQIAKAAGVRAISPRGMGPSCATLLLGAGVPVQVVARRLGHAQITMTVEVYAHSLPDMQRDAAARLAAVLAG
jgi:integrase